MEVSYAEMKVLLQKICLDLDLSVQPKDFQTEFFCRAVSGANGFLQAPCGMGKSLLYQLLPFVMQHYRYSSIEFPLVIVIQPLKSISESQVKEQKVPSCMLSEGGGFVLADKNKTLQHFSVEDLSSLDSFSGVLYSSPEVWDGKMGMTLKLYFAGRLLSLVIDEADKINLWGPNFREGYTRLSLLKPFLVDDAGIFFLTATATAEDMKIACELLTVDDTLKMNLCTFRGEFIKSINRPNSCNGWEGVFKNSVDGLKYDPGLRQLILEDYLEDFFSDPDEYPRTVILFRDQSHLGLTAEILKNRLGFCSPETSRWIQFHSLVDNGTLQAVYKRFSDPDTCYKLILMTSKGLCGCHIVDVARTVMIRPLSSAHDMLQLSGRGGRGPTAYKSSLEIVWNKSDLSLNVPGMTSDVRWILEPEGCIAEKLCKIFSYKFTRTGMCCSNCAAGSARHTPDQASGPHPIRGLDFVHQ